MHADTSRLAQGLKSHALVFTTPHAGAITMTSFISPYRADRDAVRARCSAGA